MSLKEIETYRRYHIPNCHNYMRRPKNAVYLNPANSILHERKKFEVCYDLQKNNCKFVTEAVRNVKVDGKERRIDVIDLSSGKEFEIVYKHETDEQIEKYRVEGVIPVIIDFMICEVCEKEFPRRTKKNVCQICKSKIKEEKNG